MTSFDPTTETVTLTLTLPVEPLTWLYGIVLHASTPGHSLLYSMAALMSPDAADAARLIAGQLIAAQLDLLDDPTVPASAWGMPPDVARKLLAEIASRIDP